MPPATSKQQARPPIGQPVRPPSLANILALWFGCGLSPKAPGTVGSLGAMPFAVLWIYLGGQALLLIATVIIFFMGWWASATIVKATGEADPSRIVVDEVAGLWLALLLLPLDPLAYAIGFIFFRLFDIIKPWPVSWADTKIKGGLGIMVDDILAGLYAMGCSAALWWALGYTPLLP